MSATRRAGAKGHRPFFLPLFIQVPRRGVLRTSPVRSSKKFATRKQCPSNTKDSLFE
jgi:hypothetical protein